MLVRKIFFLFIFFFHLSPVKSQITSAAQGGNAASWLAFGIEQKIKKNWVTSFNFGNGRHSNSNPADYHLFKNQGVLVIKPQLMYQRKHWQYMGGIGFWDRKNYSFSSPYALLASPYGTRYEFRWYGKIAFTHQINSFKISYGIRPEFRYFFKKNIPERWDTPFEFRARCDINIQYSFREKKDHLILINEVFTAMDKPYLTSKYSGYHAGWTDYVWTENRISLFYKHTFMNGWFDLDFGVMNQYWRIKLTESKFTITNTLMMDIIIHDLFNRISSKKKSDENSN